MDVYLDVLLRLVAAALAGMVVGLPSSRQPGGVRAHALVAVGALLFCKAGQALTPDEAELMRVVQGVATGVGFIGGAAVIKHAGAVRGVNASASIWIAAALGCVVALVPAPLAAVTALGVAGLNWSLAVIEKHHFDRHRRLPQSLAPLNPSTAQ